MPKYLIERTYDVAEEDMPDVGRRSKRIALEQFPEIVWEHSHVVVDTDGTLKSFCVYVAPNEEMVRRHAKEGGFPANRVARVATIIDPTTAE